MDNLYGRLYVPKDLLNRQSTFITSRPFIITIADKSIMTYVACWQIASKSISKTKKEPVTWAF